MVAVGVTKDARANFSHARVPKVKKIVKNLAARQKNPAKLEAKFHSPLMVDRLLRRRCQVIAEGADIWAAKPQLSHPTRRRQRVPPSILRARRRSGPRS